MTESLTLRSALQFTCQPLQNVQKVFTRIEKSTAGISITCVYQKDDLNMDWKSKHNAWKFTFYFPMRYFQEVKPEENVASLLASFPSEQEQDLCCNTRMILYDLLNSELKGLFRQLFFEAKAIELLLCYQRCNEPLEENCSSCKFLNRPMEKDKMYQAKQILLRNLQQTPTIPELAMAIGINQCYLKKGFKELFGSTIYEFVQEQRMQQAKLLLSTTHIPVAHVAERVGYSSSSSFTQAFKKYTGIFPSELQQL